MRWKTHIIVGMTVGILAIGNQASMSDVITAGAVAGASSIVPDVDAVGITGKLLKPLMGHRNASHSIPAIIIIGLLSHLFCPQVSAFITAGYVSHIILDLFNPTGVSLFWPFIKSRVGIPLIQTGGIIENIVLFPASFSWFIWNLLRLT